MSWIIFDTINRFQARAKKQELKLAEAVATNDVTTVKTLLEQGVNPNVGIVGQNCEPLMFLVFEKNWFTLPLKKTGDLPKSLYRLISKDRCLQLLLEFGANPDVRDSLGRTVLEIAIMWCMPGIVKLLLLHGANPNLRDKNGQTPLVKAAILGIRDARPMEDKLRIMAYLLDSGAQINTQTSDGKTALMYAVGNARIEVVELLVSSGASLTITDDRGNQARDIIRQGMNPRQEAYLHKILSQPQLDVAKYKYQQFIPEGDRLLAPIINHQNNDRSYSLDDIPRKF